MDANVTREHEASRHLISFTQINYGCEYWARSV